MKQLLIFGACLLVLTACKRDESSTAHQATLLEIEIPRSLPRAQFPQDNPLTVEGVALGRKLFYDPILSRDSSISCGSCHNQAKAFTDNGRPFSVGVDGQVGKRTSMPLFNLLWQRHFFWDGRASTLRVQVLDPIIDPTEMAENLSNVVRKLRNSPMYRDAFNAAFGTAQADPDLLAKALEQFLLTLISGNSKFDRVQLGLEQFTASEARGWTIFNAEGDPNGPLRGGDCFHCHNTALFTIQDLMNNGLPPTSDLGLGALTGDPFDYFKFKTSSLRNVAVSAPYMHNGQFQTLMEVLDHYDSGVVESPSIDPNMHASIDGLNLSQQDKDDLINFLKTLTDNDFLTNPAFANPFQ
jgi:cytochrome c peroxidase